MSKLTCLNIWLTKCVRWLAPFGDPSMLLINCWWVTNHDELCVLNCCCRYQLVKLNRRSTWWPVNRTLQVASVDIAAADKLLWVIAFCNPLYYAVSIHGAAVLHVYIQYCRVQTTVGDFICLLKLSFKLGFRPTLNPNLYGYRQVVSDI